MPNSCKARGWGGGRNPENRNSVISCNECIHRAIKTKKPKTWIGLSSPPFLKTIEFGVYSNLVNHPNFKSMSLPNHSPIIIWEEFKVLVPTQSLLDFRWSISLIKENHIKHILSTAQFALIKLIQNFLSKMRLFIMQDGFDECLEQQ